MAGNVLTGNPITIDTAATIWDGTTGPKHVKLIQWIDDAADLANGDDLVMVINGVTITGKIQLTTNTINNVVVWEMNFCGNPMIIHKFAVNTINKGVLVICLD